MHNFEFIEMVKVVNICPKDQLYIYKEVYKAIYMLYVIFFTNSFLPYFILIILLLTKDQHWHEWKLI